MLNLRVGCCPEPADDGQSSLRYEIPGSFFKGARDDDGRTVTDGLTRETPWTVILPVVRAIRVLERMAMPPAIDRCDPACANIARTDTHITLLRAEVAQLGEEIASLEPVIHTASAEEYGIRLRRRSDRRRVPAPDR
ncbi:MAG TPA: hypothetical protein VNW94_21080 [Streptosporangiaceae bacterium]|nr:hypothetical protein [Streptosporangiaceae bacterium]